MLSIEFYLLNATTVLLWLFQTFSHEVLLLLLLLGAICVLVSLHVTVFSLVKFMFSLVLELVRIAIRKLVFYFSPSLRDSFPIGNLPITYDSSLIYPTLDNSAGTTCSFISNRGLNLPQTLALHPERWAALEAQARLSVTDAEPNSSSEVAYRQLASTANNEPSAIPLRRSRRARRARTPYSS